MRWIIAGINFACLLISVYSIYAFWPAEEFRGMDNYIFPLFLGLFTILFLLAILFNTIRRINYKEQLAISALNGFVIILFLITYGYSKRAYNENTIDNPTELIAVVYKIDAINMDSPSSVFYRYSYMGNTYENNFSDKLREYNVGDSLIIKISRENPLKCRVVK